MAMIQGAACPAPWMMPALVLTRVAVSATFWKRRARQSQFAGARLARADPRQQVALEPRATAPSAAGDSPIPGPDTI